MQLSLNQAAELLGKTRRQVMYMIEQGQLPGQKVGGRWMLDRDDLGLDEETERRSDAKQARFRQAVDDALKTKGKDRYYSLADLHVVPTATSVYQTLLGNGERWQKAAEHMRECLDHIAVGCHRFHKPEKADAYRAARDAASLAAMEIWLQKDQSKSESLKKIEQELMPALNDLLCCNECCCGRHWE